MKRGFTLIEALTVIAIIGTLATIATYVVTSAQRQARDAKRRSDLTAIGVGFQARFEAQTCNAVSRARYPGFNGYDPNGGEGGWQRVSDLFGYSDDCGAFTEFLSSIPTDPKYDSDDPYQFNLSVQGTSVGKHFRLRANLEKDLTSAQQDELNRLSRTWVANFGGKSYGSIYSYFVGD
jgi:prepilin-type N-terminal cleavage/methylation domain-containing protein